MTSDDRGPAPTEELSPASGFQLLMRVQVENRPGMLGQITTALGDTGVDIQDIDTIDASAKRMVREFRVLCRDAEQARDAVQAVDALQGVDVLLASDRTFQLHRNGKIEIHNKVHIRTNAELAHVYTPGVGRVSMAIHDNPEAVWSLTMKGNAIAIVTDGTAVLGLGDIGPEAALPVMEGKSMLFKSFANIDAFPICLDTKDTEEIIAIVKAISPGFGGILLEDISAPRCFEIEDRLRAELSIPVFHDDQHGTAVIVLAALMNSLKIVQKRPEDLKVVVLGAGASATACTKILMNYGVKDFTVFDRTGAIYEGRDNLNSAKQWVAEHTNREGFDGSLQDALRGADMLLGLSGPNLVEPEWVKPMAKDSLVFALSNPTPEVMPGLIQGMARVIATGRSDFPNQVNNHLCFPGLFRGALDAGAKNITEEMKIVAARAIAETIPDSQLHEEYILPSAFNEDLLPRVRDAVAAEAIRSGDVREEHPRVFI